MNCGNIKYESYKGNRGGQMKNKILVYIIIIFAVLCGLTHNVYSQSDVTYFYGEILNLQNYTGTEVLLNEVNIDVGNSSVENTIIIKNTTNESINTLAAIKMETIFLI